MLTESFVYGFITGGLVVFAMTLVVYAFVIEPVFNKLHTRITKLKRKLGEQ